jgi:hypothetical protein
VLADLERLRKLLQEAEAANALLREQLEDLKKELAALKVKQCILPHSFPFEERPQDLHLIWLVARTKRLNRSSWLPNCPIVQSYLTPVSAFVPSLAQMCCDVSYIGSARMAPSLPRSI